jgi:hypothetical protein
VAPGPSVPGRPLPPLPASAAARAGAPPSRTVPPQTLLTEEDGDDGRADRRRPSGRAMGVIGAGLLGVVAVVAVLVLTLGGDDTPTPPNQVADTVAQTADTTPSRTTSSRQARLDRAGTAVAVFNGTSTTGLARQVADRLQSTGYKVPTVATAATARQTTLVAYRSDAQAEAREIAKLLELPATQVQPLSQDLTSTVGNNSVLVILGADKATG